MLKNSSKLILFVFVLVMVLSLAVTGCGTSTTTPSASPASSAAASNSSVSYNIVCDILGTVTPVIVEYGTYPTLMGDTVYGNKTTVVSDEFKADQQMTNIQNAISSGTQGIMFSPVFTEQVKKIGDMCKDAKIPFVMYDNDPGQAAIDQVKDNPYYVGTVTTSGEDAGAQIAKQALADGCKKAVLIGGAVGQSFFDQRVKGFTDAFTAGGGTVLGVARCTDPSEAPVKGEDLLSANRDADCVYGMASDFIDGGTYTALANLGLQNVKVYCGAAFSTAAQAILDGKYTSGNDGNNLPAQVAYILLMNYLDGKIIKDDSGNAPYLKIMPFAVTKANAADYIALFHSDTVIPLGEKNVKDLSFRFNSSVTYKNIYDLVTTGLSVENIKAAHDANGGK